MEFEDDEDDEDGEIDELRKDRWLWLIVIVWVLEVFSFF